MNLSISFRSELLKTRRTSTRYLGILVALFLPVIFLIDYAFQEDLAEKINGTPWSNLIENSFVLLNMLVLPFFVLLTTTLTAQMEYRNNTWKQVLVSPQPLLHIYLSRYFLVLLLIAGFILIHDVFIVATGMIIAIAWPKYQLSEYYVDTPMLLKSSLESMVCVLAMSAAEFWIALRFRNFIVPLAAGFGFWITSSILTFEMNLPYADVNPFTYLAHASFSRFEPQMVKIMVCSVVYCVVFLALGFLDFKRREVR